MAARFAAALLVACAHPPPASQATSPREPVAPSDVPPAARTLAADETVRSSSGAAIPIASGWTIEATSARLRATAPEGDLAWFHVDLTAADVTAAAVAAWAAAMPGVALTGASAVEKPAPEGWESMHQIKYAAPAGRQRIAIVRRHRDRWYVDLIDGATATLEARYVQILGGLLGVTPPGLAKETLRGPPRAVDPSFEAELDRHVAKAMAAAHVPGMAIAIVERGRVALARGWGVREVGKPARVGPDTLFMIGSTTKALTTLMMARLADTGAVRWDTRLDGLLPALAGSPAGSLELQQSVCACSGMPGDTDWVFSFEYAGATPESRLAELARLAPTTRPGETFQYSNAMVAAGGYAAAAAYAATGARGAANRSTGTRDGARGAANRSTGTRDGARGAATRSTIPLAAAYERALADLVLAPLQMTSTTLDFARVARSEHAVPHAPDTYGSLFAQPLSVEQNAVALAPAGAAWSTVRDLARVLLLELGPTSASVAIRRAPRAKLGDATYGLGLFVERDRGVEVVGHPGNNVGFTTDFFFLPEHGVGAVILANAGLPNAFRTALRRRLIELWFGGAARGEADLEAALAAASKQRAERAARLRAPEPAWIAPLLGTWTAPGLGRIELRPARLDAGEWSAAIAEERRLDGTRVLVTTGAPWPDLVLVPRGDTLVIDEGGRHERVFVRGP